MASVRSVIETGNGPEYDPRYVKVTLYSGGPWWLSEDGRYLDGPPPAVAA
jgi:hypothetical protein